MSKHPTILVNLDKYIPSPRMRVIYYCENLKISSIKFNNFNIKINKKEKKRKMQNKKLHYIT